MKRCPACNRVETDDALVFCRADGTRLVSDSGPVGTDAGTVKFNSSPIASEIQTSILPQTVTDAGMGRPTGPTTMLDRQQTIGRTQELAKHKRRKILAAITVLIVGAVAISAYFYQARKNNPAIQSVAVLPFVNATGNTDVEYLSDGITETLINSLSQLPKLSVKASSSVFRYKGKTVEPQQVGSELNVQAVLNGRLVQRGDDLTLNLELVDTQTGNQIWGEQYNRKLTDLVALQSEIARDVSTKLRVKLSGADEQRVTKAYTANAEAYQLYLKGRYYWNKRTGESLKQSIEYFNQAIEKDPNYALAYSGLADGYNLLPVYDVAPSREVYPKAKEAARRALELDDTLAEAHTSWAVVLESYEWKFAEAENEYRQAIRLNPNYGTAHQWLAELLSELGRHKEAIDEIKRAQEVEPLSLVINADVGRIYELAGQYDEAIVQAKRTIAIDKNFPLAHGFLGGVYGDKGMYEEAISEFQTAAILGGMTPEEAARRAAALRQAYRTAGAKGYRQKVLELTLEDAKREYVPPYNFAGLYAGIGDKERMYEWLQKAYDERSEKLVFLKVEPAFEPYRSEPRFQELMRKVGLPQ